MYNLLCKYFRKNVIDQFFEVVYITRQIIRLLFFRIKSFRYNQINIKKSILLGLVPTHGNLGDFALFLAAKKMIKDFYPEYHLIELRINETTQRIYEIRSTMNSQTDLVFLVGGGNMGTRYLTEEFTRLIIFYSFRKFRVIQLPQSVYFSKNNFISKVLTQISKKVYSINSTRLLILIRDDYSYKYAKEVFTKNHIELFPDNVLYLDYSFLGASERRGVLYCLRNDKETNLNENERENIILHLNDLFASVESFSTINEGPRTNDDAFLDLLSKIGGSNLVITDRLHGVIFSYITNTPVIAIKTVDHKLSQSFTWLNNSKISFLTNNFSGFFELSQNPGYLNPSLKEKFNLLKDIISDL